MSQELIVAPSAYGMPGVICGLAVAKAYPGSIPGRLFGDFECREIATHDQRAERTIAELRVASRTLEADLRPARSDVLAG